MTKRSPFRYFKASPEIIRLTAVLYDGFPLSLGNEETGSHSSERTEICPNREHFYAGTFEKHDIQSNLDQMLLPIGGVNCRPVLWSQN